MSWWQYLLLVNLYLILFYGFYALFLRKETFFQLNRVYLISSSMLSFFIPMMQADWVKDLFITQKVEYTLYHEAVIFKGLKPVEQAPVNLGQLFAWVYLAGVVFWCLKLMVQFIALNRVFKYKINDTAWSFFKKINLGEQTDTSGAINAHEQTHAAQWHSIDVLIIEAVMIVNWFNPVVYFYRRAIKHTHEFIADSRAVRSATSKTDYALLLMSQTFSIPQHQLLNHFFNSSLLKQRIIMLQKNKSQRTALLKYGLSAPLFVLMLVLSSATVNNSTAVKIINTKAEQVLSTSALISVVLAAPPACIPGQASTTLQVNNQSNQITTIKLQSDSIKLDEPVFTSVEQEPEFIGGQQKLMDFLAANIKYPADMREHNIHGKVYVSYVVEKDGSLSDVKALHGPGYGAESEAVRVVKLTSNKWIAGLENHQYVRVQEVLPIMFSLDNLMEGVTISSTSVDTNSKAIRFVQVNGTKSDTNPMYILDGKKVSENDFKTLNPDDIETIDVLKDKTATTLYGKDAENGVILIKLKKKTK